MNSLGGLMNRFVVYSEARSALGFAGVRAAEHNPPETGDFFARTGTDPQVLLATVVLGPMRAFHHLSEALRDHSRLLSNWKENHSIESARPGDHHAESFGESI